MDWAAALLASLVKGLGEVLLSWLRERRHETALRDLGGLLAREAGATREADRERKADAAREAMRGVLRSRDDAGLDGLFDTWPGGGTG